MKQLKIFIKNNSSYYECQVGTTLDELSKNINAKCCFPILAALVDNQLKELSFNIYKNCQIEFIDYSHPDGRRTYSRTLSFILQKSVSELYPDKKLSLDYTLPNGLYGEVREIEKEEDGTPYEIQLSPQEVNKIKNRMLEIINKNLPFTKEKINKEEAAKLFLDNGRKEKAAIASNSPKFFVSVYYLDGYADTFYGPLLSSTGQITLFDLIPYNYGFCIQLPSSYDPITLNSQRYQDKLSAVLKENSNWCSIIGANGVGTLNTALKYGYAGEVIQIAEALHERKYALIADKIFEKKDNVKLVLIAGPSSSGKTTTSKRLALQCKVLGLNPIVIAMDNYFVSRDKTPKDKNGKYDFEHIDALDRELLNNQLNDLFAGKEVELPTFDFKKGEPFFSGEKTVLHESDIIIMEGIHALNPKLTEHINQKHIFKIFASALTSLSLDENNNISTSDNRLLRRMIRDNNTRGISPEDTILRWKSVRNGEEKNIFPYQENSDVMFNSSLLFELPLLKYYATPLLHRIDPCSPAYVESIRLLKFLSYFGELTPKEIDTIPPTSVMREFIGGSTFKY